MVAGAAAGIGLRILLGTPGAAETQSPHHVVADLAQALALLRAHFVPAVPR